MDVAAQQRGLVLEASPAVVPFGPTLDLTTRRGHFTGLLDPDTSDSARVVLWMAGRSCGD